jgi:hypothetical protein
VETKWREIRNAEFLCGYLKRRNSLGEREISQLERCRSRCEDNIKMIANVRAWNGLYWLMIGSCGWLL